jgi:membrane fusion protein (multidrug efflux system)
MVLTALVPSGSVVQQGDPLAEFDPTEQVEAARQARAKSDDMSHQVDQKVAENEAEQAKRRLEMREAEAELKEARIQLRKGPLLSEIDRLKNEAKAEAAEVRVASLVKSNEHRLEAEAAALRVLELQRDRQQVELERAENNLSKLVLRAPLAGMVSHEVMWRNGSMSTAQEGDQLYPGRVLMRIFDPSEMEVLAQVGEPDGAVLQPGRRAIVRLDAYPELEFTARLESASPVAASAFGSPIKTFLARFRLEQTDPHLLPDLSAALIMQFE